MSERHLLAAVLSAALGVCGCMSPGQPQAERKTDGPSGKHTFTTANQDLAGSPEATVERELNRLRDKERQQTAYVGELRQSLKTDVDRMRQEEQKLQQVQKQIAEYETAAKRYQTPAPNGEEVLYQGDTMLMQKDTAGGPVRYNAAPSVAAARAPRMQAMPGQMAAQPVPQMQASPLPAQPAMHPALQQQMAMANDDIVWDPPANLFAQQQQMQPQAQPQTYQPAPAQPNPARQPYGQPQPVAQHLFAQPATQPPAQPMRQPIQQPVMAAPAPVQPEAAMPLPKLEDEIFSPDLFLSAGA